MDAVFNRGIFRRQAKGIPAHRRKHIEPFHQHEAGNHVADNIVSAVAYMQGCRRIGKHHQAVVLRLERGLIHLKQALLLPESLPFGLNFLKRVPFHD